MVQPGKVNLGLNLKFARRQLIVPSFTRLSKRVNHDHHHFRYNYKEAFLCDHDLTCRMGAIRGSLLIGPSN